MEKIIREYNQWLKQHQHFILHLRSHDASLYTRLSPLYEVLNHLAEENENNGMEFNEDLFKIFQVGFEYFNAQIDTCKLYLENQFKNDFHSFMDYERVVGYILYLEDLLYEIQEQKIKYNKEKYEHLIAFLEALMQEKKEIPDSLNLYVDSKVHEIVDLTKWSFHSIIDIFVEIAETLGIELYIESDYVLGKDI